MSALTTDQIIDFKLTDEILVARARGLRDLLRKNAREADATRTLPPENVKAL